MNGTRLEPQILSLFYRGMPEHWTEMVTKGMAQNQQSVQPQPQQQQDQTQPLPVIEADRDPWNANWLRRPKEPTKGDEEEEQPEAGDEEEEE